MIGSNKLRETLAEQFLDALQQGRIPGEPAGKQAAPETQQQEKMYRGINSLFLSFLGEKRGYTDPRWCTYNQAQNKGWQVRRGEKAAIVEYWAYFDKLQKRLLNWSEVGGLLKDPDYETNLQLRSRISYVFNAAQIDGIPPLESEQVNIDSIRRQRDTLLRNMGVGYAEFGNEAYYNAVLDTITLPPEASFDDEYAYACTFLHEAAHATGHPSRLNRSQSEDSEEYAREELRAEISSAFTAQELGLRLTDAQLQHHMDLHKAYIQGWAAGLKEAPEELFAAIKSAGEISDYLLEKGEFLQDQEAPENPAKLATPEEISTEMYDLMQKVDPDFMQKYADRKQEIADAAAAIRGGQAVESQMLLYHISQNVRDEAMRSEAQILLKKLENYSPNNAQAENERLQYKLTPNEDRGGFMLRISGKTSMPDFANEMQRPYQDHAGEISEIVVEDGVTAVGDRAFYRLSALEKVWLPNSLKRLGYWAMEDTPELQEVEYTGSEAEWQSLQKGFGCLPQQFALEPDDLVKESYLPVWARLDADGRAGTISSDFSPDALVRHEGSLSVMAVSPSFRTETFSAEQAQKGHDRDPQGSGKMSLDQEPELS